MTLVMHKSYGYDVNGILRFWSNRILRLYPVYLILLGLSFFVLTFAPESALGGLKEQFGIPGSSYIWLQNATMVYLDFVPKEVSPRLSPATWAITIELLFYFLISLGLSKTKKITIAWFALSATYSIAALFSKDSYIYLYYSVLSGSLPFSIGSMLYHFRDDISSFAAPRWKICISVGCAALVLIIICRLAGRYLIGPSNLDSLAIILTMPCAFAVLSGLISLKTPPIPAKLDKLLGDFSYPIYISHWSSALIILWVLDLDTYQRGIEGLAIATGATFISVVFGALVVRFVDPVVERIRTMVREASSHSERLPQT